MAFLLGLPAAAAFVGGMGAGYYGMQQIDSLEETTKKEEGGATSSSRGEKEGLDDEPACLRALEQAAIAASKGTYGVGAVLLDENGKIVVEGHNEVNIEGFRSDLHAEMVVMNKWENEHTEGGLGKYTLFSTLEPCPMCLTRLIFAGVGTIVYICPDEIGGMVTRMSSMPPVFQDLSARQKQKMRQAKCSHSIRKRAYELWNASQAAIDDAVVARAATPKSSSS